MFIYDFDYNQSTIAKYKQLDNYIRDTSLGLTDIIIQIIDYEKFYTKIINNSDKILIILWILTYNNIDYPVLISNYNLSNEITLYNIYTSDYTIDDLWISASRTRNYLLNDPLIDYLEFNKYYTIDKKRKRDDTFLSIILDNGIKFEKDRGNL